MSGDQSSKSFLAGRRHGQNKWQQEKKYSAKLNLFVIFARENLNRQSHLRRASC